MPQPHHPHVHCTKIEASTKRHYFSATTADPIGVVDFKKWQGTQLGQKGPSVIATHLSAVIPAGTQHYSLSAYRVVCLRDIGRNGSGALPVVKPPVSLGNGPREHAFLDPDSPLPAAAQEEPAWGLWG